jgi:hypothetical protein
MKSDGKSKQGDQVRLQKNRTEVKPKPVFCQNDSTTFTVVKST